MFQHVMYALPSEEFIWVRCLTKDTRFRHDEENLPQAVEEKGQVVVVVELLNLYLPGDAVSFCIVLKGDRKVATLVELSERSWTFKNR
jgi:hypothetical protein